MVDPSLLRQAADRGVTICFADLDGADGLWVPEERTVLVSRRLSESEVAAVIEHELTHVAIDDQHADLDAGRDVVLGHPPAARSRLLPALLTGAALVAVLTGVTVGLTKATGGPNQREQVVAPTPGGVTPQQSGAVGQPTTTVSASRGPDGRLVYVTKTVTRTADPPSATGSPAGTAVATTPPKATSPARTTAARPAPAPSATATPPSSAAVTTNPPLTGSPTPPPTTAPPPTTPPATAGPAGDQLSDATATDVASTDLASTDLASTGAALPDDPDAAVLDTTD